MYTVTDSSRISRRSFIQTTTSLAAAALWASRSQGAALSRPKFWDYPFKLGVASGDPTPDGVVLWTRLAPRPLEGGGLPDAPIDVGWQVAEDEAMTRIVRSGTQTAVPQWAHSVHVEVDGLAPDRWYFYQFKAGSEVSQVGRTRTAPAAEATPDKLRLAFASCQHWESGYYTGYEHMLGEDVDLVLHLGDYIYEGPAKESKVRSHVGGKLDSLTGYRHRHAQYKTDPALQAMHAAAPWLVTWDDHEFENNYAGGISEHTDADPAAFLAQRARAYQSYYEHMPLRRSALPTGPDMLLYRNCRFGQLVDFYVLDTRQYRDDQACGDKLTVDCHDAEDPNRSILGGTQRDWLFDGLKRSQSQWNVLAQQVLMAKIGRRMEDGRTGYGMDVWNGYGADRDRVLKFLHEQHVSNPVVLTGDIHSHWANDLLLDGDDFASPVVASEFVCTGLSSTGDGRVEDYAPLYSEFPNVKYHARKSGYVACEVTPTEWKTWYREMDYVTRPGAPLLTPAKFVVPAGSAKLERA
ncbi:MAG: alkaline phosphatase D family protein [Planctomycetaceae bacterium]|nr:alkaline phosphatase D family protein [Planctomycetaceae bacterium]